MSKERSQRAALPKLVIEYHLFQQLAHGHTRSLGSGVGSFVERVEASREQALRFVEVRGVRGFTHLSSVHVVGNPPRRHFLPGAAALSFEEPPAGIPSIQRLSFRWASAARMAFLAHLVVDTRSTRDAAWSRRYSPASKVTKNRTGLAYSGGRPRRVLGIGAEFTITDINNQVPSW